ncbi:MAG: hypothetical protein ACOCQR_00890 [bacterium]
MGITREQAKLIARKEIAELEGVSYQDICLIDYFGGDGNQVQSTIETIMKNHEKREG